MQVLLRVELLMEDGNIVHNPLYYGHCIQSYWPRKYVAIVIILSMCISVAANK